MPTKTKTRPKPATAPCAMCNGHGCEPVVETDEDTGLTRLRAGKCWWCDGTGVTDVPGHVGPCSKCGRERMYAAGEAYCPACTTWTPGRAV